MQINWYDLVTPKEDFYKKILLSLLNAGALIAEEFTTGLDKYGLMATVIGLDCGGSRSLEYPVVSIDSPLCARLHTR